MEYLKSLDSKLEIGTVFFINAKGICNFGVCKKTGKIGDRHGSVSSGSTDILFAVKYVGNGVIEEMLTGERILLCGEGRTYYRDFNVLHKDFIDADFGKYYSTSIYPEQALEKIEGKRITTYIDNLKKIASKATEYPLTFLEWDSQYEITEESKRAYLNYNNDVRRQLLLTLKNQANIDLNELKEIIDEIIQKYDINDETLEMAYLENELYNFKKRKN